MMSDLNREKLHMSLAYRIFIYLAYLGQSAIIGLTLFMPSE